MKTLTKRLLCITGLSVTIWMTACGQKQVSGETDTVPETAAMTETTEIVITSDQPEDTVPKPSPDHGIISRAAGEWKLDGTKTNENLKQHSSLQDMFGTGLQSGNGLTINETGEMEFYIGIGVGGTGPCEEAGDSITVKVTPYQEDLGDYPDEFTLHLVTEDDTQYLVMDYDGEDLYWNR